MYSFNIRTSLLQLDVPTAAAGSDGDLWPKLFEVADALRQGFNKYSKPNTTSHRPIAGNFKELSQRFHLKTRCFALTFAVIFQGSQQKIPGTLRTRDLYDFMLTSAYCCLAASFFFFW